MTAPDITAIRALKSKRSKCADVGNLDLSNVPESHETIWLQWGDNGDDDDTWCADNINDEDVPYIRADLVFALCDEMDRLRTIIDNLHHVEKKHRDTANDQFHRANRLRAENERLRAALQPFADYMHTDEGRLDLDHAGCELPDDLGVGWIYLNHGDFRRAQAVLAACKGVRNE